MRPADIQELVQVTAPGVLPITLAEAKVQLRLESSDASEDTYLTMLISAAVEWGEAYTGRAFINRTLKFIFSDFPIFNAVELPISPVSTVSAVKYLSAGALSTMPSTDWVVPSASRNAQVCLAAGKSWPTDLDDQRKNVTIEFTAGYGAAAGDVPAGIRMALLQFVGWAYTNRGDCDVSNPPSAIMRAFAPYRVMRVI